MNAVAEHETLDIVEKLNSPVGSDEGFVPGGLTPWDVLAVPASKCWACSRAAARSPVTVILKSTLLICTGGPNDKVINTMTLYLVLAVWRRCFIRSQAGAVVT
jgi:hypothetical protein